MEVKVNRFYLNKSNIHNGPFEIIFTYREQDEDSFKVIIYNVKTNEYYCNNYYVSMFHTMSELTDENFPPEIRQEMLIELLENSARGIKDL